MSEEKIPIGTEGIALEAIPVGETGEAYFPALKKRATVYAVEDIRKNRDIIIVGANNSALEHTPQELKFEREDGTWQRVTEKMPLPIDGATAYPASVRATASGNTLVKAPSSGKKLKIKYIEFFNSGTTSVTVYLRFTKTGTAHFRKNLAAQTGFNANLIGCNWRGGEDEALYINLSANVVVDCTILYQEE